jgi:transcriptional regulator with XRE-family HTH domain
VEENIYLEFGKRLAELRLSIGMSQNDISKKLGIAQTTYSGYENGVRKIPLEFISALADILNVSPTYLISGKKPKSEQTPVSELSMHEKQLVTNFRLLNEEGQEKLSDYADDLVSSGKYKKLDKPCMGYQENAKQA